MSNNNQQEIQDEVSLFTAAYLSHINELNNYLPRIRNIAYNSNTNTTTIYGHTNFQELNVNNSPVALQSQIPDISTKANLTHSSFNK